MTSTSHMQAALHYDLRLDLCPDSQFLRVAGSLVYDPPDCSSEEIRFLLHRQFEIISFEGPQVQTYRFHRDGQSPVPYIPEAADLVCELRPDCPPAEPIEIRFVYEGHITRWPDVSCNLISPDWVELGMYLPWFPLLWDPGQFCTFRVRVHCPPEYRVAGYGAFDRTEEGWEFSWEVPTQDIVVVCSPHLRLDLLERPGCQVQVTSSRIQPETSRQFGDDALRCLAGFTQWFGPTNPASVHLILSPRTQGGGYGRRGLVVLGGFDPDDYLNRHEAYLRYLAHEIAHGWWWAAPVSTWEDWLNESFAEVSALLMIEERFGVDAYHRRIEQKRRNAAGTVPLGKLDRLDLTTPKRQEQCEIVLYDKGPVILHDLMERIGKDHFLLLCKRFRHSARISTANFLDMLEIQHGAVHRTWLHGKIYTE